MTPVVHRAEADEHPGSSHEEIRLQLATPCISSCVKSLPLTLTLTNSAVCLPDTRVLCALCLTCLEKKPSLVHEGDTQTLDHSGDRQHASDFDGSPLSPVATSRCETNNSTIAGARHETPFVPTLSHNQQSSHGEVIALSTPT